MQRHHPLPLMTSSLPRSAVLTLGEGDFSYSLSLAGSLGGTNLVATGFDKKTQVLVKYGQGAQGTMSAIESMGAVIHNQVEQQDSTVVHG